MTQPETSQPAERPPSLIQNWVSMVGLVVVVASLFAFLLLMAIDLSRGFGNPYLGILTYLVAPGFLIGGLALVVIGVIVERAQRRKDAPSDIARYPRIDFNVARQRKAVVIAAAAAVLFLAVTAFGSYGTYHFTESASFCGKTCHTLMTPEYTAYHNSPHARVACVQCHIGPGASWFVKSKLSGTYQVYATLFDKYPRPIPTPVKNLRPAQETCEQCHWPQAFYGNAERVNYHYLPDSANTAWTVRLLLKVGGGNPARGPVGGIHWHMNISNTVEYIASDSVRQVIPWVRIINEHGDTTVYRAPTDSATDSLIASTPPRRMDCIDCHNRPTHIYNSPSKAVNLELSTGRLSAALPWIKKRAVEVLSAEYDSTSQALDSIAATLTVEYQDQGDPALVRQAVTEVQNIYRNNFFPAMKADWRAYPDNIGHSLSLGCFRCHDGKHARPDGKVISKECTTCHIIISQGTTAESRMIGPAGLEFEHPVNIGGMWKQVPCAACHKGGNP
jgi:NapC/NirT cytochrome c family, N-terminal region